MADVRTSSRQLCRAFASLAVINLAPGVHLEPTVAAPVTVAAPWAIIVHGSRLPAPITMADWEENLQFMLAIPARGTATSGSTLRGRPFLELALFWGPEWQHLSRAPESVARLRPDQANQRGWLFLAQGDQPAAVVLDPPVLSALSPPLMVRDVGPKGIAVLTKHGVPVRAPR